MPVPLPRTLEPSLTGGSCGRTESTLPSLPEGVKVVPASMSRRPQQVGCPYDKVQKLATVFDGMNLFLDDALRVDITAQMKIPTDLWPVIANPNELELVIQDMVLIAQYQMRAGHTLKIDLANAPESGGSECRPAGSFIRIEVSDAGAKTPLENPDRASEPRFPTKEIANEAARRLRRIHTFATQSGGHLTVTSSLDHGTSVSLYLPRAPASAAEARTLPEPPSRPE